MSDYFPSPARLTPLLLITLLAGCTTVGPQFTKPKPAAPADWTSWRSTDQQLRGAGAATDVLRPDWWRAFNDPMLNQLEQRAVDASPDLRTAALRFAQSRAQRVATAAQSLPEVDASGGVTRQRQSEYGAGTRLIDAIGGDRSTLAESLSAPFTLYQAGLDASWELDLWGRVQRSIEAADADVAAQAALLDLARLSLASDLARNYVELRTAQHQTRIARDDIAALEERLRLMDERMRGGIIDHIDPQRQRADMAALKGQLPALLAQVGVSINQIALLLGQRPGALREELGTPASDLPVALPDLVLGLPSEVALRRPDIRAAEARLHAATASIGIAQAELYPSIRLGARFGFESYLGGEFSDWGSRAWSVGPSVSLPLFDRGRRKSTVQLRELQQQDAAVNYHQTVLKAWQEIDDALSGYTAEMQQLQELQQRTNSAEEADRLVRARYDGGMTDFLVVLDSQRTLLQAKRDLIACVGRLNGKFIQVNRVLGNI